MIVHNLYNPPMKLPLLSISATLAALLLAPHIAAAQQEFPPPSGKGRVVIVAAGASGALNYRQIAGEIAKLGYDAVLFESNGWANTEGKGLRDAIAAALRMLHVLPGKVGLVGFSLGGGYVLSYGTAWSEEVAVVAAWYPSTSGFGDVAGWASRVRVPTVMFAGENDIYNRCCLIDKARAIGNAAQAAGAPFELTTYPNTPHGFVLGSDSYKPVPYGDAFARTQAALRKALD
jgi:dienelactone hydrolase